MKIDAQAMKAAYAEVEILKGKLNSLFYKMEDRLGQAPMTEYNVPVGDRVDVEVFRRYVSAQRKVDNASNLLLEALDNLRT